VIIYFGALIWLFSAFFFLLCTSYYILELIPAYIRHRKHYLNNNVPNDEELCSSLSNTNQTFPKIKFQITTRGNEVDVVKRGILSIAHLAKSSQLFERHIELLVVTDIFSEVKTFSDYFQDLNTNFPTKTIFVPKDYKTPRETVLKARSLQYAIDYRKNNDFQSNSDSKSYIFYFDAESTINEINFRRILHAIIASPEKKIFEGPIVYPHKYFNANVISRQMESSRPFNCHHCVQIMKKPPPIHLHGSNLLVEENFVNSIGWDFGKVKNQPLLAEDLFFGLKVFSKYGAQPFGWHGGRICEQPPFSISSSVNARLRWITGAWQAVSLLEMQPEFQNLPWHIRAWIIFRIRLRIITHSLSFFAAIFVLLSFLIFFFPTFFSSFKFDSELLSPSFRTFQFLVTRFILLPGTIFWIFGIVNGTSKNIEPLNLSLRHRLLEYGKILLVTPIAGAIESFSALYASVRWILGKPYNSWNVTEK
jgi:hypothetical protein